MFSSTPDFLLHWFGNRDQSTVFMRNAKTLINGFNANVSAVLN